MVNLIFASPVPARIDSPGAESAMRTRAARPRFPESYTVILPRRGALSPAVSGEVTGDGASGHLAQRGLLGGAPVLGERAARAESAAARHVARIRGLALERERLGHAAP